MKEREALKLAANINPFGSVENARARDAAIEALAQPEHEPVTIWYMRDNHTFKKLSADVSIALIEIEQEFNEGYTYGMLCSKRAGFPSIHASGEKKRLEFFAECKKTLEEWIPNTTPPQRTWVGLTVGDTAEIVKTLERGNFLVAIQNIEAKLKEKNCDR